MSFDFDAAAFEALLNWKTRAMLLGAEIGMHDATDLLVIDSRDLAPLDKRGLRDSVHATVTWEAGSLVGEVTYSVTEVDGNGNRINYALYMHEFNGAPEYNDPTTPGTQPKFLEQPLHEHATDYAKAIAREIGKELS